MLDAKSEGVRKACEVLGWTLQNHAYCRPGAAGLRAETSAALLVAVDIGFDNFGDAKRIVAVYGADEAQAIATVQGVVAQIEGVLQEERAGDLAWCGKVPRCNLSSYAQWSFEGGEVWLRSEFREGSFELTLEHRHNAMEERVTYGLPVCAR